MKQFSNSTTSNVADAIQQSTIIDVLRYFSFFNYPPTFGEIYTFLKKKASKRRITAILKTMQKKSLITSYKMSVRGKKLEVRSKTANTKLKFTNFQTSNFKLPASNNLPRYTLQEYSIYPTNNQQLAINNFLKRQQISVGKLSSLKFRFYLKLLSHIPQISLIGLSGSVAMLNASEDHDIDLFIITAKNRLWTGRFIALFLAQLLGIRRHRHSNNLTINNQQFSNCICLNLFFDESDLEVPKFKKTDYVAHEILQMKPLIDRDNTYLKFIDANKWVFDIFPNAPLVIPTLSERSESKGRNLAKRKLRFFDILFLIFNFIQVWVETILKKYQLHSINKHRTTELISNTQLWFHPIDFSKKIKL